MMSWEGALSSSGWSDSASGFLVFMIGPERPVLSRLHPVICCLLFSHALLVGVGQAPAQHQALMGTRGMVVSAHPEASRAGVDVLRQGGNVVDAAVAVGFVLAVTYPRAGNIGGGGFAVLYLQGEGSRALDFRETAPARASETMFLDSLGNLDPALSTVGALAAGVPGTVAGLYELHRRYGALSWAAVLEPAVRIAEEGFLLSGRDAAALNTFLPLLSSFPSTRPYFTKGDSTTLFTAGERFVQTDLARTLRLIQQDGRDGFYGGITAQRIVSEIAQGGGCLAAGDLSSYVPRWREPLQGRYRGYDIVTMPPPSSGGWALLSLLKMVEPFRLDSMGFHSSATVHLMGEAMARVFADRAEYLGDPDFADVPLAALLDSAYLAGRMRTFSDAGRTDSLAIRPGLSRTRESRETTHYCVADSAGNMVAVTYTLNHSFGSMLAVGGAGFLLNNEMDDFSAKPGIPNAFGMLGGQANRIQPGKRMLSSMAPTIVLHQGRPVFTLGAPGGPTIITRVFQVVTQVLDFRMNIQDAVAALRFHHQWPGTVLEYEAGAFPHDVLRNLAARGWTLRELEGWDNGGMNAILIDSTAVLHGAADPRRGDAAAGY
jgi:gamma-glutamyltranspeptidase/glutathione hydrolase